MVQDNRIKIISFGADGNPKVAGIMDVGAQTFTHIDYGQHQYITATMQEYAQVLQGIRQALAPKIEEAMKKMQESVDKMPPEQRKVVEQTMKTQMEQLKQASKDCPEPPPVEVRKTDQRETVAGYSAVRYDVLTNGKPQSELWVAKDIPMGKDLDVKKLEQFSTQMAKLAACTSQGQGNLFHSDPIWKIANEGYPVRIHSSDGRTVEVTKAESKAIPATEFQPPADFTKKTLQEVMQGTPKGPGRLVRPPGTPGQMGMPGQQGMPGQ